MLRIIVFFFTKSRSCGILILLCRRFSVVAGQRREDFEPQTQEPPTVTSLPSFSDAAVWWDALNPADNTRMSQAEGGSGFPNGRLPGFNPSRVVCADRITKESGSLAGQPECTISSRQSWWQKCQLPHCIDALKGINRSCSVVGVSNFSFLIFSACSLSRHRLPFPCTHSGE